jgi:hypothetical protein
MVAQEKGSAGLDLFLRHLFGQHADQVYSF